MGSSILVSRAPCFALASSAVVWACRSSGVGLPQSAPSLSSSFSRKRSKSKFLRSWPPSPPPSMAPPWSSWRTAADRSTAATWSAFLASSWAIVVALSRVWILKAFTAAVEGPAFLALFLVPRQWRPLPHWGLQEILVQLHGAVPDHRPDRGGDEVREAGLVRVLACHRVGGQLADVHRGAELEVAGPVRIRAFGTCGPGRRPDRIALVIHCQLPVRARHFQGGQVVRRVDGLRLLATPLPGALLHPGHGATGANPGCGFLTQGAVLQAPISQASALASLLSRGAEQGLMLILHLGDVERLDHTLQAPLLELGALSLVAVVASKHGKSPDIWSSLNW